MSINFNSDSVFNLKEIDKESVRKDGKDLLIEGESIEMAFHTIRDQLVFTNKRIIAIDVQGITGKKKDFTSMPYSKISVFSVETAGTIDLDSELELYFSGVGKIKFEFSGKSDIVQIGKLISQYTLR